MMVHHQLLVNQFPQWTVQRGFPNINTASPPSPRLCDFNSASVELSGHKAEGIWWGGDVGVGRAGRVHVKMIADTGRGEGVRNSVCLLYCWRLGASIIMFLAGGFP